MLLTMPRLVLETGGVPSKEQAAEPLPAHWRSGERIGCHLDPQCPESQVETLGFLSVKLASIPTCHFPAIGPRPP